MDSMAVAKQKRNQRLAVSSVHAPKGQTLSSKRLEELYARLKKTQPGSEESKALSEQIVDAIG